MPELESVRSIAQRLVREYREKRELRIIGRLIDSLPAAATIDPQMLPPALRFDLTLTPEDREFLRKARVLA